MVFNDSCTCRSGCIFIWLAVLFTMFVCAGDECVQVGHCGKWRTTHLKFKSICLLYCCFSVSLHNTTTQYQYFDYPYTSDSTTATNAYNLICIKNSPWWITIIKKKLLRNSLNVLLNTRLETVNSHNFSWYKNGRLPSIFVYSPFFKNKKST